MAAGSVQATRIRKGNLIKHNGELFRVLDTQHVTPGNLRGFVRAKLRNVRSGFFRFAATLLTLSIRPTSSPVR